MKDLDAMDSMEKMLVQKAYQRQAPVNGSLELLPLCNMNCDMCYAVSYTHLIVGAIE